MKVEVSKKKRPVVEVRKKQTDAIKRNIEVERKKNPQVDPKRAKYIG